MGDHFAGVWQSNHCPPTLKKMIFRTAIEEIIVRTDQDKKNLELVIHWKGGAHTQLAMERDRKSTRLNSSHQIISYAVFCLKKKRIDPRRRPGGLRTLRRPWQTT